MPPKATTTSTILTTKCIKFGLILIDENRKPLLLCDYCYTIFTNLPQFCQHLKSCNLVKNCYGNDETKKLNCDANTKLFKKITIDSKEILIYNVKEKIIKSEPNNSGTEEALFCTDLVKIEEELLDPRWYDDAPISEQSKTDKNTVSYSDLIDEVTPFVQFKENIKTITSPVKQKEVSSVTTTSNTSKGDIKNQVKSKSVVLNKNPASSPAIAQSKILNSMQKTGKQNEISRKQPASTKAVLPLQTKKPVEISMRTLRSSPRPKTEPPEKDKPLLKRKAPSVGNQQGAAKTEIDQSAKRRKTLAIELKTSLKPTPYSNNQPVTRIVEPPKGISPQSSSPSSSAVNSKMPVKILTRTSVEQGTSNQLKNTGIIPVKRDYSKGTVTISSPKNNPIKRPSLNPIINQSSKPPTLVPAVNKQIKSQFAPPPPPVKIQNQLKPPSQISSNKPTCISKPIAMPMVASTPIQPKLNLLRSPSTEIVVAQQPSNNPQTVEILNKLQTLGLKVKRTNPPPLSPIVPLAGRNTANEEIIRKLQSKGMQVKVLPKSAATTSISSTSPATINIKRPLKTPETAANNILVTRPDLQRHVLIKKIN